MSAPVVKERRSNIIPGWAGIKMTVSLGLIAQVEDIPVNELIICAKEQGFYLLDTNPYYLDMLKRQNYLNKRLGLRLVALVEDVPFEEIMLCALEQDFIEPNAIEDTIIKICAYCKKKYGVNE